MGDVGVTGGCVEMVVRAIVDLSCPVLRVQVCLFEREVILGLSEVLPVDKLDANNALLRGSDLRRDGSYTLVSILLKVLETNQMMVTSTYASSACRHGVSGPYSEADEPSPSRCAVAQRCSSIRCERPPTSLVLSFL